MPIRRRRRIAWALLGTAALATLAYLPGRQARRSGGLVEVARWLDHPALLLGGALVLTLVAWVVRFEFRSTWSQVLGALALISLATGALYSAVPLIILSGWGDREVKRQDSPAGADRVLRVADVDPSIDPAYRVEVISGSGWSARHWTLGTWDESLGGFQGARWTGPDEITVTTSEQLAVFAVGPDGRPGEPRVTSLRRP
ncbi:hypothetical protein ACIRBX_36015 [Kitasatospora sp. NPDC096147]|uniref:hypothetical protein n=1 Tax=Kitasatospora sp. NPDC096147 TaxID=3364093 RepID=UPI00380F2E2B